MGATSFDVLPNNEVIFPESVFRAGSATQTPFAVQGATGQTANLFEAKNAASTLLARINSDGGGSFGLSGVGNYGSTFGVASDSISAIIRLQAAQATVIGIVARAMASQTASLQEWQDNAGTALARVQANGVVNADIGFKGENSFGGLGIGGVRLAVHTGVAGATGIVVKAAASQTNDLMQFQNSAGSALQRVDSNGNNIMVADRFIDFGPNTTWGAWLRVGGNGHTIATGNNNHASIVTTNGNIHIDAARGTGASGIYLNFYNGSATNGPGGSVIFGNGATTEMARINKNGDLGIGMDGVNIDARIHMRSTDPARRYTQMSPIGANGNTLNLIAGTNSAGGEHWWAWGVGANNVFHINTGTGLNSSPAVGFSVHPGGHIQSRLARFYGGVGPTTAAALQWGEAQVMLEAAGSGTAAEFSSARSPRISFHVPGNVAPQFGTDASGVFKFWATDGTNFSYTKQSAMILANTADPGSAAGEGRLWSNSGQLRWRHPNGSDYYVTG